MANTQYKIGDKTIDLNKLISIGEITNACSGRLFIELSFENNGNVKVFFNSGENGLPQYRNLGGDYTNPDSDFWRDTVNRIDELKYDWSK